MAQTPFRHLSLARRYFGNAVRQRREEKLTPIQAASATPDPAAWPDDRVTASWLGHATVLLNFAGTWLITDPVLGTRVGVGHGFAKLGPRRLVAPALTARELPALDLVLLSHAHMDHTDKETLRRIPRRATAVVQSGNLDLVRRFRDTRALGWGESTEAAGVEIESVEVRHWGARMITDHHRGYGGYLLRRAGRTVLFAGDTADTDTFTPLGRREPIDLAIMPIGAYDPWIHNHCSPEQAWRMFQRMGARWLLPIHHGTFRLSREPDGEPVRRLLAAAGAERDRVVLTSVGETFTMP